MKLRIIGLILLLMLIVSPAMAQDTSWSWTAPTDGSEAAYYLVGVSIDGGPFVILQEMPTTPNITITQEPNREYRLRVAGVDAEEHQGGWSVISDPSVWSAPGACGKPRVNS